jgi:hypothetical protein
MTTEKIPQMPIYLQPHPMNEEDGVYELNMEHDEMESNELTIKELKILNLHGYVYQSEITDVEFDYEDEDGNPRTGSQDIYYFTRIAK